MHTREVLALLHEVCRQAGAAFPQTPDDLWITNTGELRVARSDRTVADMDARAGVANLLDAMLPNDAPGTERAVPASLRGLPARLRANAAGPGPKDRQDLVAILSWHLGTDPREQIQRFASRATQPEDGAVNGGGGGGDDLDLFTEPFATTPAPVVAVPPRLRKLGISTVLAVLALGCLFLAIGAASYWLFREPGARAPESGLVPGPTPIVAPVTPHTASTTPPPHAATAPRATVDAPEPAADSRPEPLRLDVAEGAFSPAFATNGRELFFHAGRSNTGRMLMANLDDGGQVSRVSAVLEESARNYHPRVSPNGRLMAFDSDRDGERGVYVSERDGSNPQRVSGDGYAAVPSWSPDMKWLAFVRGDRARSRVWNLWLRDLASGAMQRHTSFRVGQVWGASWFPDGRSLCYSHEENLVISHLDGREDIVIPSPRPGHLVRTPAVSPDGQSVVFQVFRDGVWVLDIKTRSMRRVLGDAAAEEFSWAPDGRRVAYHSRRDGAWKIWVMPMPRSTAPR